MQTYQLHGPIQNTSYREQYKNTIYWEQYINTRYREQYKLPVTVNNTNILITGSKTKIPVTVDNASI
jgi:hypothetical protein